MLIFLHHLVDYVALGIEALAVLVIVAGVLRVLLLPDTLAYAFDLGRSGQYETYKHRLGRPLVLGLDLLLAGDVVRTIALDLTLPTIAALGLLAIIRTFLSWSLTIEMEHRLPWLPAGAAAK
jgi:uncharacterized membrane protein